MTLTKTETTSGLQTFFQQDSFFGISMNATTALVLSSVWSLKTSFMLHLKTIKAQKIFFGIKASCCVAMWGLIGSLRRILSIVCFFTPSLGLFSILNHWLAEQYHFDVKTQKNLIHPKDQVQLFNLTETILWSDLDRWNYYGDPDDPTPPSYSLYTGFTLKWTFALFLVMTIFHVVSMLMVKTFTSKDYREDVNVYHKMMHLLENINCSIPYKDWDENESITTKDQFKKRFEDTEKEMIWSQLVNICVSMLMLIPIWFTGV